MASPLRTCNGPPLSSRRRAPADGLQFAGSYLYPAHPAEGEAALLRGSGGTRAFPALFVFRMSMYHVRLNGGNLGRLVDTGRWDIGGSETVVSKGRHTLLLWESSRASAHHPLPPYCLLPPARTCHMDMILGECVCALSLINKTDKPSMFFGCRRPFGVTHTRTR